VLSREEALRRFAGDPPRLVPGIGPKTVARLERMGIHTLAELHSHDPGALKQAFGPRQGAWLQARARFEDETPIAVAHETKSQSTETTFDTDVADHAQLAVSLASLSEELCRRLRSRELAGRTIGIKVRLDDWTTVTRVKTIDAPTNDPEVVGPVAQELLEAYSPPRPVRLLGVRVAGFARTGAEEDDGSNAEPEPEAKRPSQLELG
jgi:DNA polymerase-4